MTSGKQRLLVKTERPEPRSKFFQAALKCHMHTRGLIQTCISTCGWAGHHELHQRGHTLLRPRPFKAFLSHMFHINNSHIINIINNKKRKSFLFLCKFTITKGAVQIISIKQCRNLSWILTSWTLKKKKST